MKRFFEKCVPVLWSICWATSITAVSIGAMIWSVKWLLQLIGVI